MNRLNANIYLTLVAILFPIIGISQQLTIVGEPNPVCKDEIVTFTATASNVLGTIQWHALYKNDVEIERDSISELNKTYTIVADTSAVYIAKMNYTHGFVKGEIQSNPISLIVNQPTSSTYNISACDSYLWHGDEYNISGTYYFDTINADGCKHTDSLYLTVFNSSESYDTITECDHYNWHGFVYNQSGDYIFDTINVYGCDSTMHLNLTINTMSDFVLIGDDFTCDNSESLYTITPEDNETYAYQWEILGGTILGADSTATIVVRWDKTDVENKVSASVTNKNTGCSTSAEKTVLIQSFVNENLNRIVAKKNSQNIPYILIYPNPSNDYHYQWYKNGEALEGENGQYLYLHDNTSSEIDSIYRVYVGYFSDDNSIVCGKYSDYYVNNYASETDMFTISPNPINNSENLNVYMDNQYNYSWVNIYSAAGNLVFKGEINGNPFIIHADFSKGLYVIELIDNQGAKYYEKVIIK